MLGAVLRLLAAIVYTVGRSLGTPVVVATSRHLLHPRWYGRENQHTLPPREGRTKSTGEKKEKRGSGGAAWCRLANGGDGRQLLTVPYLPVILLEVKDEDVSCALERSVLYGIRER